MRNILIDTGPLVALFNRRDKYFTKAISFVKNTEAVLLTTAAVITEVTYLLDFNVNAQIDFLNWVGEGGIQVVEMREDDYRRCAVLMKKYYDLPMDFADAALVVLGENLNIKEIATIDKDFEIYRINARKKFKNVFVRN